MTTVAADAGLDRSALEELYADYCDLLDDDRLEEWLELFAPDARYRAVARENWVRDLPLSTMSAESQGMLADRVTAIRTTSMFIPRTLRHIVGRLRVRPADGDGWSVRASWLVSQSLPGEPTTLFATGVYHDLVVRRDDRLLFAEKVAVYDAEVIPTSLVYPL